MANIRIPEEAIPALFTIVDFDQVSFDSLLSVLKTEAPTISSSQFASKVLSKLKPAVKREDVFQILGAILPLYGIREENSLPVQRLADEIGEAALETLEGKFPTDKIDLLKTRLAELLSLDKSLAVIAKANNVMTEHERIFCHARIMSDVRSVFTETLNSAAGAMVIHMLQVGFHHMGKHQEFYVALDNNDLKSLKAVIDRAERKTGALKKLVQKSGVPYLEV